MGQDGSRDPRRQKVRSFNEAAKLRLISTAKRRSVVAPSRPELSGKPQRNFYKFVHFTMHQLRGHQLQIRKE